MPRFAEMSDGFAVQTRKSDTKSHALLQHKKHKPSSIEMVAVHRRTTGLGVLKRVIAYRHERLNL
jgi:hypothetical protein